MTEWPPVWVLFVTYKRTKTALQAAESLGHHIIYPNIHWHICDDGSGKADNGTGEWHVGLLADKISQFCPGVTWHEMNRSGPYGFNVGGNINRGMKAARENGCRIVLTTLDDFALARVLDLRPMADLLSTYEDVGFIRLSYWVEGLAGTCVRYPLPRLGKDYMWMRLVRGWSLGNPWGPEPYILSMQPHIAHLRFFDAYGWYPEGLHPGRTETQMCSQYNDYARGEDGPQILFPIGERFFHVPYRETASRQSHYVEVAGDIDPQNISPLERN